MYRLIALAAVLLGLGPAPSAADELPQSQVAFSADVAIEIAGDRITQKLYHDRGLERLEMTIDGLEQVTILRPDRSQAYVIQKGLEGFIELPIEAVWILPDQGKLNAHNVERLGEEKEGGEATTKYHVSSAEDAEEKFDLIIWITDDGIPMRIEGVFEMEGTMEGMTLLSRNVQRGAQDPKLFEPGAAPDTEESDKAEAEPKPEGYKEVGGDEP